MIPDQQAEIIDSIRELSRSYSLVFTSGGIGKTFNNCLLYLLGPTHDDLTYDAIAEAFGVPLQLHTPTVKAMHTHYKTTALNDGQLRMATIPQPTAVIQTPGLWVPLVQTRNVLILPGVPLLFTRMIDHLFSHNLPSLVQSLNLTLAPRMRISIKTDWKESALAAKLKELQKRADGHGIALGSYPKLLPDGSTHVIICVSGAKEYEQEIKEISSQIQSEFNGTIQ